MEKIETPAGPVSVTFDGPNDAALLLVLAHGAGANKDSDFMSFMARSMGAQGVRVCRFNFVYTELGRRAPDRQNVLEDTYRAVVAEVRDGSKQLVAGGKSLGGRIASLIAAGGAPVDGLVFLGYPLHPPGKPDRIRKAHLPAIKVPMLFVEGTRDPFCPLDTLDEVRAELTAPNEVAVIEDAIIPSRCARARGARRTKRGRKRPSRWVTGFAGRSEWGCCRSMSQGT